MTPSDNIGRLVSGSVSQTVAGRWCRVSLHVSGAGSTTLLTLEFFLKDGSSAGPPVPIRISSKASIGHASVILFVPTGSASFGVGSYWALRGDVTATITFTPWSRMFAAFRLAIAHPTMLGRIAVAIVRGRRNEIRREIRSNAMIEIAGNHRRDYQSWVDGWEPVWVREPPDATGRRLWALIFGDPKSAGYAETAHSLTAQDDGVGILSAMEGESGTVPSNDYVLLLQAGEILATDAIARIRAEMVRLHYPTIAIADHDLQDDDGRRSEPTFQSTPNHTLMLSGTAAQGVWVVRADRIANIQAVSEHGKWAEGARLASWLQCYRLRDSGRTVRLPFVLTHRSRQVLSAPQELLGQIVNDHLVALGSPFRVDPVRHDDLPLLRMTLRSPSPPPPVSILIPSTLKAPRFLHCIETLLRDTELPDIEVIIAVGPKDPMDSQQRDVALAIQKDPRVRVMHFPMPSFNYSTVNNLAASLTRHPLLLLLNDDVAPIAPGWLKHMIGHLTDGEIGIVGPRLLYADGTVQHGGVLLGLAGMCDHASRNLPGESAGYRGRAVLDQEMSSVTGACLLIRREAFTAVGGLDESYPSAFNDVDLCLKVREAGWGVVYAGSVALTHYELQTYGAHYAGERATYRDAEIARFRARWASAIDVDPFHNPNLGLNFGAEWELAFPSRAPLWQNVDGSVNFRRDIPDPAQISHPHAAPRVLAR
jgi:GT2 family glycosyltransferase